MSLCFKKNSHGFTLLEVLLSLTILSILMVYVFNIVDSSTTTKDTIVQEDREYLQVLTALERLNTDLSQMYSPLYFTIEKINKDTKGLGIAGELFQGEQVEQRYEKTRQFPRQAQNNLPIPDIFNESPQELIFFSNSNRRKVYDAPESELNWVRYRLQPMPQSTSNDIVEESPLRQGTQMLTRTSFSKDPYREEVDWESSELREHPLLKGVKDFEFSFWNQGTQDFVSLLRQDPIDPLSPRLIRVEFTWISSKGEEYEFEKTFRTLWPKFNRRAEEVELIKVMQETVKRRREAQKANQQNDNDERRNFND